MNNIQNETDDIYLFRDGHVFSNDYICTIIENGMKYTSVTQYIHAQKALINEHSQIYLDIMKTNDPKQIRLLSNMVTISIPNWEKYLAMITKIAVFHKFTYSDVIKGILLNTGNKTIGYQSITDLAYGTGRTINQIEPKLWIGKNKLGNILMEVRELINKHEFVNIDTSEYEIQLYLESSNIYDHIQSPVMLLMK